LLESTPLRAEYNNSVNGSSSLLEFAMRVLIYLGSFALTTTIAIAAIAGFDGKNNSSRDPATESRRVNARSQSFFEDGGSARERAPTPQKQVKNC
jgi:hypothetical protein